ncbi:MAG TPA: CBS domain-containing protein, partial [Candidatus Binataceae bacterium]|nr:CBS domain-containing protein [Candidatus Binataceae bacterium]
AAAGMAAFIAGGYKTPLTAVVFVAETTGGHSFIIPSLISAAVAYAVSGEASVSGDQHLHETARLADLTDLTVREVMCRTIVAAPAAATLAVFANTIVSHHRHTIFPVLDGDSIVGTLSLSDMSRVAAERWSSTQVSAVADRSATKVEPDLDLQEALRLLVRENGVQMLLVVGSGGTLEGILTKTDILRAVGR